MLSENKFQKRKEITSHQDNTVYVRSPLLCSTTIIFLLILFNLKKFYVIMFAIFKAISILFYEVFNMDFISEFFWLLILWLLIHFSLCFFACVLRAITSIINVF